nr:PREDICTED: T-cell immunoglobulin and mucin domain-containing protein 4-like [Latimeria chalumnae]|eukprot:XP_006014393.2 PREDICTED: T-cell immunoglobulin and mucin domain-containing protein 4-like [Latimeria chalumnae]
MMRLQMKTLQRYQCLTIWIVAFALWDAVTVVYGVEEVEGVLGRAVTLPCSYPVQTHGLSEMCWGTGHCSAFRCNNVIIQTDKERIIQKKSEKYNLHGDFLHGNVSLTIENVTEQDRGEYCCRVEKSGLFNDLKYNYNLVIRKCKYNFLKCFFFFFNDLLYFTNLT